LGVLSDNWVKVWLQESEELEDVSQELTAVIYAMSEKEYTLF
jgi:hypothetical protein